MEFLWRIFPLLRANRLYAIFNTGLKKRLLRVWDILFVFFHPEYLALVPSATNPVQQLTFSFPFFRWQEEGATSVLGSQPIVLLLPSSFLCQATRVRLPSTNICWSPHDPHSFLTVILWRLATVNSNTRIVVILFLSSQWDTTWHE